MTKFRWLIILTLLFSVSAAEAQYTIIRVHGAPPPPPPRYHRAPVRRPVLPPFKPTVSLNIGYGFPNLDQNHLAYFYNYYRGNLQQTGPITGSIDYRFSRVMSVGVMATYGKLNTNYYSYGNSYNPSLYAHVQSYAIMFNMMNYFPAGKSVSPYLRTAAGVNIWEEDYRDISGNKVPINGYPTSFAYQLSMGARFNLSEHAGIFVEAGYGKYIAQGGLSLSF